MGFLKRLFSRRSKKTPRPVITHNVQLSTPQPDLGTTDEDTEALASRLLRSSSTRFAVVNEISFSDLPPLPHPINNVVNTPPSASTTSLASTATGIRPPYTVHVTARHKHSTSGSSKATTDTNEECDSENRDLHRLRSDPSVASLLLLYDQHGRLPENTFHNSPTKYGRSQAQRGGSTLRELLGPENDQAAAGESDISWADRVLGESGDPTLDLQDSRPTHGLPTSHALHNDNDISYDNSAVSDFPSIGSLEVEVSSATDATDVFSDDALTQTPHKPIRRASEVFDFLKDSEHQENQCESLFDERPLPELPGSAFSSPSSDTHGHESAPESSASSSDEIHTPPAIPFDPLPGAPQAPPSARKLPSPPDANKAPTASSTPSSPSDSNHHDPKRHTPDSFFNSSVALEAKEGDARVHHAQKVKVIMTVPTTVIVTAPTPTTNQKGEQQQTSRIPRGPRGQPKRAPGTFEQNIPMLVDRPIVVNHAPHDPYTQLPYARKARGHNRTPSSGSTTPSIGSADISAPMKLGSSKLPRRKSAKGLSPGADKENGNCLVPVLDLPSTPVRSRSLARGVAVSSIFQSSFKPTPSPPSSTERALSPVGRNMMKEHRKAARTGEKEKASTGTSSSMLGSAYV